MTPNESIFLGIRGARCHVRAWGPATAPKVFLLHGWMDVSASFQFMVDALPRGFRYLAPDALGTAPSGWSANGSYWYLDRVAELAGVVDALQPDGPLTMVGHSMGFNIASLLAGIRPARVGKLVNLECYGHRSTQAGVLPERLGEWLNAAALPAPSRPYASLDVLSQRLMKSHPGISAEQAAFLARHYAQVGADGQLLPVHDPRMRSPNNKMPYVGQLRFEDALVCWRASTASLLWVRGAKSDLPKDLGQTPEQQAAYRAAFRIVGEAVLPDGGHAIHIGQAAEVAAVMTPFLLDQPKAAAHG